MYTTPLVILFFGNISQFFRASFVFRRKNQKLGKSKVGTVRARGGGNETHSHLRAADTPARTTWGIFKTSEIKNLTLHPELSIISHMAIKIIYKHWKSGKELEVTGTMPRALNNQSSDRFVVQRENGTLEDIIKSTVLQIIENPS